VRPHQEQDRQALLDVPEVHVERRQRQPDSQHEEHLQADHHQRGRQVQEDHLADER
jgi:hypothetical protein